MSLKKEASDALEAAKKLMHKFKDGESVVFEHLSSGEKPLFDDIKNAAKAAAVGDVFVAYRYSRPSKKFMGVGLPWADIEPTIIGFGIFLKGKND